MVRMYLELRSGGGSATLDHVRSLAQADMKRSQQQVIDLDGTLVGELTVQVFCAPPFFVPMCPSAHPGTVAAGEADDSSDDDDGMGDSDGDEDGGDGMVRGCTACQKRSL